MIEQVVRPASRADIVELEWLEERSRGALRAARGGARWLATHPAHDWSAVLGRTTVATLDGVAVGYLVTRHDDDVVSIIDVYVHDGARELGFGDALLEAATDAARAAGARYLEGTALPGDRHMKNLYERAGITARMLIVSKVL